MKLIETTQAAEALVNLERMVAAVKGQDEQKSKFAKVLGTLESLAERKRRHSAGDRGRPGGDSSLATEPLYH